MPRLKALRSRLVDDRSGATAVEFALVALPLFFMLFAIVELAMVYLLSVNLEDATTQVARTIRTGEVQKAGGKSREEIQSEICKQIRWLATDCDKNLKIDVRTFAHFKDPSQPEPVTNGKLDETKLSYAIGEADEIVLIRSFYTWTPLSPFLKVGLTQLKDGTTLLTSAATFRNEPYG